MILLCNGQLNSLGTNHVAFYKKWLHAAGFGKKVFSGVPTVQLHYSSVYSPVCTEHTLFSVHKCKAKEMCSQVVLCKTLSAHLQI